MALKRTRNFACLLYEDSVPDDFIDIINSWHVPAFLSPYHDSDVNPHGELKKAHWHLMIMFDSVKTVAQAKELFDSVNGVGLEVVNSQRGYARYLCHLDNPEKFQYNQDFITEFSGADYNETITLETDKIRIICEMQEFCLDNDILSFAELLDYCAVHRYSWYRMLVTSCSLPMMYYLKSRQWEKDKQYKRKDKYFDEGGE